jgi:uncharacterized membrane protein
VANVAKDLHKTAEKFYVLDLGQDAIKQEHPASDGEVPNEQQAYGLPATSPGYVEKINYKELLAVARRSDILVRLETRPGEFVVAGDRLALIWPSSRVDNRLIKDLSRLFTMGTERSTEIDVEFPVEELLEMSDRVLTENINDLFIASTCLDWLKECLTVMMHKPERASDFIYADGKLRIIVKPYRVSELIDYIFEVFWNSARNNQGIMPIMSEYILEAIAYLAPYAERDEERQALKTHAEAVGTVLREKTLQDYEKKRIRSQYARTMQALMRGPGKAGSPSPQQDAIIHA